MIQWWWLCCLLVCGSSSSSSRTTTAFSPTTPHHPEHCFPRQARMSTPPALHASPTDLPLYLYQDTVDALETSLQDIAESLSRTQDLTARLVQLDALLAVDDDYDVVDDASSEEEEDSAADTTAVTDDALLLRAVKRALATSQLLGRDAPETELAWIRVRLSNNSKQHPLLAHPSYRDNYGAYLLRQHASSSSACAPSLEAQLPPLQQAVADLQDRLRREQAELQRRHARRARGIAQARQSFFLKQDSSASSSSST